MKRSLGEGENFFLNNKKYQVKKDYGTLYIAYVIENNDGVICRDNKGRAMYAVNGDYQFEKRIILKSSLTKSIKQPLSLF